MAREIQPKKKIVVANDTTPNLESGYMKAAAKTTTVVENKEHRLTIDISSDLFDQMDEHRKDTGQSYKGLVTFLLKKFFAEK
jgi:hypothetical protein